MQADRQNLGEGHQVPFGSQSPASGLATQFNLAVSRVSTADCFNLVAASSSIWAESDFWF